MKKKRNIIKKKLTTGLIVSSLLLTACSAPKEEKTPETVIVVETVVVTPTPTPTPRPTPTPKPTPTPTPTPTPIPTPVETEETPPTEYHSADGGIDAFWDDVYNDINYLNYEIDTFDYEEAKEKTVEYAKELIDFIFYGAEIDGVTFEELKETAKEKVYLKLQTIDAFLMQIDPDYKEKIGEKYNLVKDFASTTLDNAKEIFNSNVDIDININTDKGKKKTLTLNRKSE